MNFYSERNRNMDTNKKAIIEKRIEKTINALEKNKMKGYYVKSRDELLSLIDSLIRDDKLITSGGSMTLAQTGVIDHLNSKYSGIFHDRAACKSPEETQELFRKAYYSDTYFVSSNAITENGELYNVDGNGNRVSAMIFGPKQVIVVTGYDKIVTDLDAAKERVEKIAAPANALRLGLETPCSVSGECMHCHSDKRICCSYVTLGQQRIPDRIKVIFLGEELGL